MQHSSERADLGKADAIAVEPPNLRMRLTEGQRVAPLSLPPGSARQLGEAALPGPVQFHQELRAHVARDVREPQQSGTQFGEFVDLIEGRGVAAFVSGTGETDLPLFEREVPEKPQSAFPRVEASDLRRRRVDAEPKSLHNLHRLPPDPRGHAARALLTPAAASTVAQPKEAQRGDSASSPP